MTGILGIPVIISPLLPRYPTEAENVRRFMRWGLKDVLEWCGEPVGPKEGEPTHAIFGMDPAGKGHGPYLFVSQWLFDQLKLASVDIVQGEHRQQVLLSAALHGGL